LTSERYSYLSPQAGAARREKIETKITYLMASPPDR
jgi:hypothetical protein